VIQGLDIEDIVVGHRTCSREESIISIIGGDSKTFLHKLSVGVGYRGVKRIQDLDDIRVIFPNVVLVASVHK